LPVVNLKTLKVTTKYKEQCSGKSFLPYKKDELLLYCQETHLLASLYVFVCRFRSVAPISCISLKAYIGDFRENLLRKPSLVKISPKMLSSYPEALWMTLCSLGHYIAIKALSSREVDSGC
jgi:hypothetical protein